LRDAIATTPSGGTVDFKPDLKGTITLTTAQLVIAKNLTIAGPGADVITVSGDHTFRVFNIGSFTVAISGLTIADGRGDVGGGILSSGNLTLTDVLVSGNTATDFGGGIDSFGTLIVTRCFVTGNTAINDGFGGGIDTGFGMATITESTISGNAATRGGGLVTFGPTMIRSSTVSGNSGSQGGFTWGGGIYNNSGTVTIINSTISGNETTGDGGGIINFSTLSLISSTLSGNAASGFFGGGGIYINSGTLTMKNNITAGNTAVPSPDVRGTLTSLGHNLIRDGTGGSGFNDTDLVGTADFPIDPQLEPLGDYGGPTQTMRPLPGSPVINTGDNTDAPDTDQRGFPRIVLDFIDIGAVELQPDEFGPRSPASLLIAFVKPMAGSWGSVVEAPVSPVARHEVNEPLQHVDTAVQRAKDLVFGESHRAQRPVLTSAWEGEVSFV
jgi:hypothetical protein